MPDAIRSSVVIARLLDSEGFTDHTANQIERYWKKVARLSPRQQRQILRLEKEIASMAAGLTEGQRLAMGRFIGLHKKMSFETGLRIGLTAYLMRVRQTAEDSPTVSPEGTK